MGQITIISLLSWENRGHLFLVASSLPAVHSYVLRLNIISVSGLRRRNASKEWGGDGRLGKQDPSFFGFSAEEVIN